MPEIVILAALGVLTGWAVLHSVKKAKHGGGCCPEHGETERRNAVSDRNRRHYPYTVTLRIGGMTCENCARRVENTLNGLDGVWASVDIGSHSATVRCKLPPDTERIRTAVAEAGYAVLDLP